MTNYIINAREKPAINFAPSTVIEEVIQNVRHIISSVKWSIPLDRDLGISGEIVDMPILQAKARLTQEIIEAVKTYEPRALIQKIDFDGDITGRLIPRIEVKIVE